MIFLMAVLILGLTPAKVQAASPPEETEVSLLEEHRARWSKDADFQAVRTAYQALPAEPKAMCRLLERLRPLREAILSTLFEDTTLLAADLPMFDIERITDNVDARVVATNYAKLAQWAPASAQPLFAALNALSHQKLWGPEVYQKTDLGGCTELRQVIAPVRRLVRDWEKTAAAPECIRAYALSELRSDLAEISKNACPCGNKKVASKTASALGVWLKRLPELDGPQAAERAAYNAAHATNYDCAP